MIRKPLVALAVFATALVLLPAVAGAHVEIESDGPPASDGAVAATVAAENECPDNGTLTNVELSFPATPELTYDVMARRFERGSEYNLAAIREHQPELALFGHVHNPLVRRTRIGRTECVNVGHFRGRGTPYVLEW